MLKIVPKSIVITLLLAANLFGCSVAQPALADNSTSEYTSINVLGIDTTAFPGIRVNIIVDASCTAGGGLDRGDLTVREDATEVPIDDLTFTGRSSGQKLDLAVVFDETSTMAGKISALQSKVDDLTNRIRSSGIDARYALITFRTDISTRVRWTDDADAFRREVGRLRASGGFFRRPEDSLGGVAHALSFGFRQDAKKIIVVITDEPSMQRGDGWSGSEHHEDDVRQDLVDGAVLLVAVSPDFRGGAALPEIPQEDLPLYADMRDLAESSGGLWIDMGSADFSVILDQLEEVITGAYVVEYTSPSTTTPGIRTVTVTVNASKCARGESSKTYTAPAIASAPNEPPVITALTSDKTSPQAAGSTVTWTAEAEDPEGDQILYRFFINGEPAAGWTAENRWTWNTTGSGSADHQIEVRVVDKNHASLDGMDDRRMVIFRIFQTNSLPAITSLAPDRASPQVAGAAITWTATAKDADGDALMYRFLLDGEVVRDWSENNTWVWITSEADIGSHNISAGVRDGKHAGPKEMDELRSTGFEIIVAGPEVSPAIRSNEGRVIYRTVKSVSQSAAQSDSILAMYWFDRGVALEDQGKHTEAAQAYDEAIRFDPGFALAWNNKGLALADLGRYSEAVLAYDEAIRLDPGFALAWNNKGVSLGMQGKYPEAVLAYDEAIRLDPTYALAWNNKGVSLGMQGRYSEAILAHDEAIRLDPGYALAWNSKGIALADLGRYDEAILAYDEAIRIDPEYARAWNNKGMALKSLGRTAEAEAAFSRARELELAMAAAESGGKIGNGTRRVIYVSSDLLGKI
ncbi:MAG: lipoprotein NlpI [Methanosaeta sp. PtaB.Bin039]|nr:MAG: lipoprotein NlpI [Methanosaeta sp. PtaB.Bin039]